MGDCNLRISVSEALWEEVDPGNNSKGQVQTARLSSDATIADVLETPLVLLTPAPSMAKILKKSARLWDCTCHPPKDISRLALDHFPEKTGPRSLTLYDAGWYPSGLLTLTATDEDVPRHAAAKYDDVQYNIPSATTVELPKATTGTVQLKHHSGKILPSQLLQSVASRFDGIDAAETDSEQAHLLRHETAAEVRAREAQRQEKLQERIRKLDQKLASSTRGGGVASQVQKMLIKSRATGRPNLTEQDRVYLRVILDKGDDTIQEDFRYFSRQDVVGKVLSSFPLAKEHQAELLVRKGEDEYRRLPNLVRFYEAADAGLLANFDRVVIRLFDPTKEEPTPVFPPGSTATPSGASESAGIPSAETNVAKTPSDMEVDASFQETGDYFANEALAVALAEMESKNKRAKTTKSSAAVTKVRQMQMKSKAKGDTKRVKMPDRFFLEIVVAQHVSNDNSVTIACPPAPYLLGKSDPLQRLVKDGWVKAPLSSTEFLITPQEGSKEFRRIADPSESVLSLSSAGVLSPFDRIIVYYQSSDTTDI